MIRSEDLYKKTFWKAKLIHNNERKKMYSIYLKYLNKSFTSKLIHF
jgi:hypothetical protein